MLWATLPLWGTLPFNEPWADYVGCRKKEYLVYEEKQGLKSFENDNLKVRLVSKLTTF